jgi:hypothetical protein
MYHSPGCFEYTYSADMASVADAHAYVHMQVVP